MKENLFVLLLSLFETTLAQIKQSNAVDDKESSDSPERGNVEYLGEEFFVRSANADSMRVFTDSERFKLTKASYQFLMRMCVLNVIGSVTLEQVLHRLLLSDSRFVSLEETKWTLRDILADDLSMEHLSFVDLLLEQNSARLAIH